MLMKRTIRAEDAIEFSSWERATMDKIEWRGHTVLSDFIEIRPMPARSTNRDDYQRVPRPLAALAKDFPSGLVIAPHSHPPAPPTYAAPRVLPGDSPPGD